MHKRGLCRHAVSVCLSVRPSVTFVNKDIFEFFSLSRSQAILAFPRQTGWQYSDGNPLTGASNTGGVGKAILDEYLASLHTGLQCCQPYESGSVKNSRDERRQCRALDHRGVRRPLFAQDDDEVFVTGSTLYAEDERRSKPSRTQPPWALGDNACFLLP